MKKTLFIVVIVALTLLVLAVGGFAQKKHDVVGTWVGYAIVGDGGRVDITVVVEKGAVGYTGKISDSTGMVPETQLKNIVFNDGKLTFEFDMATESTLIKIELTLENETLKGAWFDSEGNTDLIELTLKK